MQWWLTALITACIVMLAHHLGLITKVADVISQIAGCCRCSVFWAVLAITVITGVEPLLCVFVAIVLAYASEWASLCLFAANKLYDTLWQRIKNQHRRNIR